MSLFAAACVPRAHHNHRIVDQLLRAGIRLGSAGDALLIHLKRESFLRIFDGQLTQQNHDALGITHTIESEGLIFTCFIPHNHTDQAVQLATQKESA